MEGRKVKTSWAGWRPVAFRSVERKNGREGRPLRRARIGEMRTVQTTARTRSSLRFESDVNGCGGDRLKDKEAGNERKTTRCGTERRKRKRKYRESHAMNKRKREGRSRESTVPLATFDLIIIYSLVKGSAVYIDPNFLLFPRFFFSSSQFQQIVYAGCS